MAQPEKDKDKDKPHAKKYHFFVDGNKYETDQSSITGAGIKAQAGVDPAYQLFLEADGDDADRPIGDTEGVDLTKGPKHYYAVPPATFGGK